MSSTTIILPLACREASAISRLGSRCSWSLSCSLTASASSALSVTSTALARLSCSAWDSMSAATYSAAQVPSATMSISLGPAIISMATRPYTCLLASATYALPGPTILSTAGTLCVPYAKAATLRAARSEYPVRAGYPGRGQYDVRHFAARRRRDNAYLGCSPLPWAGMQFISSDDGRAAVPPGT